MVSCESIALNPLMNDVVKAVCDWNQRYLDGDTPWDKGLASPALEEVIAGGHFPVGSDVLIPGCGYGHDVREIAESGCVATGMDISASAVSGAKLAHKDTTAMFERANLFDSSLADKKRYDIDEFKMFISKLDNGYKSDVFYSGSTFSNGERQLLSFARLPVNVKTLVPLFSKTIFKLSISSNVPCK